MKKKLARILAVVLVAMMLIPIFATLAARADTSNASTLVNHYDTDTEFKDAVPDPSNYGNSLSAGGHRGCVPFDVKAGDTIYFGPAILPNNGILHSIPQKPLPKRQIENLLVTLQRLQALITALRSILTPFQQV